MTSAARIEANRRNAQKSTGPKSAEGKARSAQNALSHGLTAEAAVLPHEDASAFEAAQQRWFDDLLPEGEAERALVERAALASWRLRRCARSETARLAHKVRHAGAAFERAQHARALALGNQVVSEPINRLEVPYPDAEGRRRFDAWLATEPANLVRELESFSQGVEWLMGRWTDLGRILRLEGYWHYPEKFNAIRILGRRSEDVLTDETVATLMLACQALHPARWQFCDDVQQACLGRTDRTVYYRRTDHLESHIQQSQEEAMGLLMGMVESELERLGKLKAELLDPLNDLDRAEAADRAALDATPEGTLARRYETACERELHKALADLEKLRKDRGREHAPPADVEPIAEQAVSEPDSAPRNEPKPKDRERPRRGVRAPKPPRTKAPATAPGGP